MKQLHKSRQGFALVLVIWILTLLSLMAGSFALSMRRDNSVSLALKKNAQAQALTESGLNLAIYMMQNPAPEQRWQVDGTVYQIIRADGSQIRIRVLSESGKIDINTANDKLLAAVIKSVTNDMWAEQKLLNSILDWRDADEEPRPHGGERKQYQDAGLAYGPSNSVFQSLEELQLVLGMEPQVYIALQPVLTVYSGQPEVNIEEATPQVLQILNNQAQQDHIQNPALQKKLAGQTANNVNPGGININQNSTYTFAVEVVMEDNASASLETVIKLQGENGMQSALPTGQANPAVQAAPGLPGMMGQNGQNNSSGMQVMDWKQNQLMPSLFANGMESQLITIQNELTINN